MSVTFSEPFNSPFATTVTLRNPLLGNSRGYNIKTLFKQDMASAIHSHKRTPPTDRLLLTFTTLTRSKKDEVIAFYRTNIGKALRYVDHDAVIWAVRFTNAALPVTTVRDGCSYDLTIEATGTKT